MKRITIILLSLFLMSTYSFSQDLKSALKLTESEQFDLAEKAYKSLIAKDAKVGDNYFYLGENFLESYFADSIAVSRKEMEDSALVYYTKGSIADPNSPLNFVGLGKIAYFHGDITKANDYFDNAQTVLVTSSPRFSSIPKDKQAWVLAKIGETYITASQKNVKEALKLLQSAIGLDEKNPSIFIIIGDAYLVNNDGSNAVGNYKRANDIDPKLCVAKTKIGELYLNARNPDAAIPYFNEAIQIDPNYAPAYRELGEAYSKLTKYADAKQNYQKFLELSKNYAAKTRYASFLFITKDYMGALKEINEVQVVDTSSVLLYRIAAYSYYELDKPNEAIASIKKYIARARPEKVNASDYYYYGKSYVKLGKDSLAIVQFKNALKKDSLNSELLTSLAISYQKLKNSQDAIAIYEKKQSINKASLNDLFNLGKLYLSTKQFEKADTTFGTIYKSQPTVVSVILFKARARSAVDPDSKNGLATPYFLKLVEKASSDSVKYSKELIESLEYLGAYHLLVVKDYKASKNYYLRLSAIDPKNEKAKIALGTKELKTINN